MNGFENVPILTKVLTAGASGCFADALTFPLDTAKVRLQIQGESRLLIQDGAVALLRSGQLGLLGTMSKMIRQEGPRSLYNGLSAGLQRQMCFASVRIGLYDTFKTFYQQLIYGNQRSGSLNIGARVAAGLTSGALAVFIAQPTDVVKVRLQAATSAAAGNATTARYTSSLQAYKTIAATEGLRGLWKGTFPNVSRNAIVNVSEIVCYDIIKDSLLCYHVLHDGVLLHFTAAVIAGFCATVVASPVDVVRTRYMNSPMGQYKGAVDCGVRMLMQEGSKAFYKGFVPSFARLVSWNIAMWITYEQVKLLVIAHNNTR